MQIERFADTEKITLNIGYVDLGKIDLLVHEGYYSNRSDFIRTAIRNQLSAQSLDLERVVVRQTFDMGLREFTRQELEYQVRAGQRLSIRVIGLVRFASDVTGELAASAIDSLTVLGALQASPEIKSALAARIH